MLMKKYWKIQKHGTSDFSSTIFKIQVLFKDFHFFQGNIKIQALFKDSLKIQALFKAVATLPFEFVKLSQMDINPMALAV